MDNAQAVIEVDNPWHYSTGNKPACGHYSPYRVSRVTDNIMDVTCEKCKDKLKNRQSGDETSMGQYGAN